MKKFFVFLCLFVLIGFVSGCVTPDDNTVIGITISSEGNVRTIKVGETLQLSAKVFPETADQTVNWQSSNDTVATVNEAGLVSGVSEGTANVVATSKVNPEISKEFSIIIEKEEEKVINPESIVVTAENNVTTCKVGESIKLSAVVSPAEASQSVSWESSDTTVATVARGEVSALKEGTVTITVYAKGFENVKASIELTFEPSDDPVLTKDWANMEYTSHEDYMEVEDETPIKVKGVVTHVNPVNENEVTYLIQNGADGYYVYAQNNLSFPVELGKSYEIGGFKKYYRGLNEITNVEYFKELDEQITYSVNELTDVDVTSLSGVSHLHCSFVKGTATFSEGEVATKAYSFYAMVNGKSATFRVDPSYMTSEEFSEINKILSGAVKGMSFEFTGFMSAFGYGTPSPQIMIVKASDLKFAKLSDADALAAASTVLTISSSIAIGVNEIELPKTIEGFDGISVAWASDSELINLETGVVTHGSETVTVTLTATLTKNSEKVEKTFDVTIFAEDNNEYEVLVSFDCEDAEAPNQWGNSASKSGYAEGTVTLGTPKATWLLRNALIAAATNDIYDGSLGIRAQAGKSAAETGRIEIQQDGEYNVVEFAAAVYGNDASGIQIKVEYSTDSGTSWVAAEGTITIDSKTLQTYRVSLPEGAKRVALVIVENSGRRVNIDNIKLMK